MKSTHHIPAVHLIREEKPQMVKIGIQVKLRQLRGERNVKGGKMGAQNAKEGVIAYRLPFGSDFGESAKLLKRSPRVQG